MLTENLSTNVKMFDQKQIAKLRPHVQKLVSHFEKEGITFSEKDGDLENVVFTGKKNGRVAKISYIIFYRWSGIAFITKAGVEKNSSLWVEVDDKMFYDSFMRQVVDVIINPPKVENTPAT